MACYHPSRVCVSRKGSGGLRVADMVTVPCGHCLGCRSDQARQWAVRLVHEGVTTHPAWFVTLTYSPEEMPHNGSLFPGHFTAFVKRMRRQKERVAYYVAGEYGETTARPHYHAVLYGVPFLDRVICNYRNNAPVYRSGSLERYWPHGISEFTGLNYAAARYVASYVRKKVRQVDNPDAYVRVDPLTGELVEIEREYGRMSRRPAIGLRWIERFWSDVYPRDFVVMDGHELKPPRFYDKWMDKHHPQVMAAVREKRYAEAKEISPEQLLVREGAHRGRVNLFQGRDAV